MRFLAFLFLFASFLFAKLDVNSASEDELKHVRGIGATKAKAIVEYRKKNGNFTSIEDLVKVKGFGLKNAMTLKDELEVVSTLTNPPTRK